LAPVHKLQIQAISTNPSPVNTLQGAEVLPVQNGIQVIVVLTNVGNQQENDLTVTAEVRPARTGFAVQQFASLAPGDSRSVQLGNLYPLQGRDATLTVTVTPRPGSPTPVVSRSITILMPSSSTAPPTAPTTSTTMPTQITTPTG
ncbi:MAG: hypothetical protein J2P57_25540, partial [Acidimicrobiaceae bacterium]|nr:hypothetical protein [Acidimicrobiaceae bacterium]